MSALASPGVDIQLILVDDASTDGSETIAKAFEQLDANITNIRTPKSVGPYVCRNMALAACTGDYIAFLDSDDTHNKNRLLQQIAVLEKFAWAKACYTSGTMYDEKLGARVGTRQLVQASLVFRRTLINEIGYFDSVRFGGDTEFFERMKGVFGSSSIAVILDTNLYNIRVHANSLTRSGLGKIELEHGGNPVRMHYEKSVKAFYAVSEKELPWVGFPQNSRPNWGGAVLDVLKEIPLVRLIIRRDLASRGLTKPGDTGGKLPQDSGVSHRVEFISSTFSLTAGPLICSREELSRISDQLIRQLNTTKTPCFFLEFDMNSEFEHEKRLISLALEFMDSLSNYEAYRFEQQQSTGSAGDKRIPALGQLAKGKHLYLMSATGSTVSSLKEV